MSDGNNVTDTTDLARVHIYLLDDLSVKVDISAPSLDVVLNILAQATRTIEDQRRMQVAEQFRQNAIEAQKVAALTRLHTGRH